MRRSKVILAAVGIVFLMQTGFAQRGSFPDHLRIGFGAGANSAHIIDLEPYSVYEDLTGEKVHRRFDQRSLIPAQQMSSI